MPKYSYTAINLNKKKVRGVTDAKDEKDLRRLLRAENLIPSRYRIIEDKNASYRLKPNETSEYSRQLASMLSSGITVLRALDIIRGQDFKPRMKQVFQNLFRDVQQGFTLSEAMAQQGRAFPELLINMYASGEASGQLERVAAKMAVHYEKEHRLNNKVKSAMTYPILLLCVTFIVVMLIFTVIMPQFFELFSNMDLPAVTRFIISLSHTLQHCWYMVIIGVLVAIVLIRSFFALWAVALWADQQKLRLPVIGKLLKTIYTARFARTLSSLYSSGISMINALEITSTIIRNRYVEGQFGDVIKNVRNGEILSVSISAVTGFDPKLPATILIGEESGRLDSMLEAAAENFDYEAETATTRLVQLIEPLMIIFMAVVIGAIMLSVMLPLMSLYQQADSLL